MPAAVEIDIDVEEELKRLEHDQKEMRFVLAKSLTRTAKRAQKAVQDNMPRAFTIRNQRVIKGIRISPARKTQPDPTSTVGSIDDFMALQETGGTKKPAKGARSIAVPDEEDVGTVIRRSATGKITKATKPKGLLARSRKGGAHGRKAKSGKTSFKARYFVARPKGKRPFIAMTKRGSVRGKAMSRKGVAKRKGRRLRRVKYRRIARRKLNKLYALPRAVQVKPRLDLLKLTIQAAERYLDAEILQSLRESLDEGKGG